MDIFWSSILYVQLYMTSMQFGQNTVKPGCGQHSFSCILQIMFIFCGISLIGGEQSREGWKAIEALSSVYEHWIPKENIIKTNTWSSELSKLVRKATLKVSVSLTNNLPIATVPLKDK